MLLGIATTVSIYIWTRETLEDKNNRQYIRSKTGGDNCLSTGFEAICIEAIFYHKDVNNFIIF